MFHDIIATFFSILKIVRSFFFYFHGLILLWDNVKKKILIFISTNVLESKGFCMGLASHLSVTATYVFFSLSLSPLWRHMTNVLSHSFRSYVPPFKVCRYIFKRPITSSIVFLKILKNPLENWERKSFECASVAFKEIAKIVSFVGSLSTWRMPKKMPTLSSISTPVLTKVASSETVAWMRPGVTRKGMGITHSFLGNLSYSAFLQT